ncbi:tyrosine-type recombinase/integrase [Novosphingobium kaempferiae]|uniref:tyrosine-type recombinase/integrase n=1 Tax=Novosphingobium kaempferiae TaxID=2896849 RepID=UPI001E5CC7D4|nr:integrase arm-type DNA-binding domain-containing protein [Novosphingobium kaempferiae]
MGKLNALGVKNAKPGRHGDGDGLYLVVKPTGAKSWILRVQRDKMRRDIGLGSLAALTLAEAREKAAELRKHTLNGRDPIAERDRDRRPIPTFKEAAKKTHAALKSGWVGKSADAFLSSLETYAFPSLGNRRVDTIDAANIQKMLTPIWTTKPELAHKLRMRVGQVLNFAHSKGWRTTEAPGRSVGVGLPKQPKGGNFAAMPYPDVPAFMTRLGGESQTSGRRALMFLILTAARPGEVRFATWGQIDFKKAEWNRPAEIMKLREPHTVTLSKAAMALLSEIKGKREVDPKALIFPGQRLKPLSDMALSKVMRDAGLIYNAHAFRSSFRDWAAEKMPDVPDAVAEAALAHTVPDKVVRAYKRTKFMEMRRTLMDAWGEFLSKGGEKADTP